MNPSRFLAYVPSDSETASEEEREGEDVFFDAVEHARSPRSPIHEYATNFRRSPNSHRSEQDDIDAYVVEVIEGTPLSPDSEEEHEIVEYVEYIEEVEDLGFSPGSDHEDQQEDLFRSPIDSHASGPGSGSGSPRSLADPFVEVLTGPDARRRSSGSPSRSPELSPSTVVSSPPVSSPSSKTKSSQKEFPSKRCPPDSSTKKPEDDSSSSTTTPTTQPEAPASSGTTETPTPTPTPPVAGVGQLVRNLDTGEVINLETMLSQTNYTTFKPKPLLIADRSRRKRRNSGSDHHEHRQRRRPRREIEIPESYVKVRSQRPKKGRGLSLFRRGVSLVAGAGTETVAEGSRGVGCLSRYVDRIQKLAPHSGPIWVMKFSRSGKYLATGSQDGRLLVFETCFPKWEVGQKFINEKPLRTFLADGRGGDVVALAWNKTNFLCSSTMDRKVRVWHTTGEVCLVTFVHFELVTGVAWHPTDEQLFCTASFDEKIRLFNFTQSCLLGYVDTREMLTAVAFSKTGRMVMAGTYEGRCVLYDVSEDRMSLRHRTTFDVRSRRGKNQGKKVTGIVVSPSNQEVMISTNDSRVRVYSLVDFSETAKFSGHVNKTSQIFATYSADGRLVISGSENKSVYVWDASLTRRKRRRRLRAFDWFGDSEAKVTNAVFAPFTVRSNERVVVTSSEGGVLMVYLNPTDDHLVV